MQKKVQKGIVKHKVTKLKLNVLGPLGQCFAAEINAKRKNIGIVTKQLIMKPHIKIQNEL
jgi:hypothetical protein